MDLKRIAVILATLLVVIRLTAAEPAAPPPPSEDEPDEIVQSTTPVALSLGEENFWKAMQAFQKETPESNVIGRSLLDRAAELEYSHAQATLANCLQAGSYGYKRDPKRAVIMYRFAAERGNAYAMVSLAECLAWGNGTRRSRETARTWLEKALGAGADYSRPTPPSWYTIEPARPRAATVAGELQEDPAIGTRAQAHYVLAVVLSEANELEGAHKHFAASADAEGSVFGKPEAAVQTALDFAFGRGVQRNLEEANRYLDLSTKLIKRSTVRIIHNYVQLRLVDEFALGDLEEETDKELDSFSRRVQKDIATAFADKKSKDYNPKEARRWYKLAADNGDFWAGLDLGIMLAKGDLGEVDMVEARALFGKFSKDHSLAAGNYGICLQHGLGGPVDLIEARKVFEESKNESIICHLGTLGKAPAQPMRYAEMQKLEDKLADTDPHALFLKAMRYEWGWGIPQDGEKALRLYEKAMKQGDAMAEFTLAQRISDRKWIAEMFPRLKPIDMFKHALSQGVTEAYFNIAYAYDMGVGVPADRHKAAEYYEQLLLKNPQHGSAYNNLAVIQKGWAAEFLRAGQKDQALAELERSIANLEKGMEAKSGFAASNLGNIYAATGEKWLRDLIPVDEDKAFGYFVRAAELESTGERHRVVAERLESGLGTSPNLQEAIYHYRIAAMNGDKKALRKVCGYYLYGKSGEVDLDRALLWLDYQARQGEVVAIWNVVDILLKKERYKEARELLSNLSDSDEARFKVFAQSRLYRIYRDGWGVKPNPNKAQRFLKKAEENGFAKLVASFSSALFQQKDYDGCFALLSENTDIAPSLGFEAGAMIYEGQNIPVDHARGVKLLRVAAASRHPASCYYLAALAVNRKPEAPSLNEALAFAQVAVDAHVPGAEKVVEIIKKRLNKDKAS